MKIFIEVLWPLGGVRIILHGTVGGLDKAGDKVKKGSLAAAGLSNDSIHIPFFNNKINITKNF